MRPFESRLRSVDALRGAAALAVLLLHATQWDYAPTSPNASDYLRRLLTWGELGVPLFFVISGFCIHLPTARARAADPAYRPAWGAFWKRRIYRLYPPYFVVLCLSMAMVALAYHLGVRTPLLDRYPDPKGAWIAGDFLAHVTMTHGLHPLFDRAGGNPVYWTLAREEYLYLLYFPLAILAARYGMIAVVWGVAALGVLFPLAIGPALEPGSPWHHTLTTSAIALWIQWALGALAAEWYVGRLSLPNWCRDWRLAAMFAALAVLTHYRLPVIEPGLWGLAFFATLNAAVHREARGEWYAGRIARWLASVGVWSYSLYLVHNLARIAVKQVAGPVTPGDSWTAYWAVAAVTALAGYASGFAFFSLVESRFLAHRSRVAARRDQPALAERGLDLVDLQLDLRKGGP